MHPLRRVAALPLLRFPFAAVEENDYSMHQSTVENRLTAAPGCDIVFEVFQNNLIFFRKLHNLILLALDLYASALCQTLACSMRAINA